MTQPYVPITRAARGVLRSVMEHLDTRSSSRTFWDELEILVPSAPAAMLGLSRASETWGLQKGPMSRTVSAGHIRT